MSSGVGEACLSTHQVNQPAGTCTVRYHKLSQRTGWPLTSRWLPLPRGMRARQAEEAQCQVSLTSANGVLCETPVFMSGSDRGRCTFSGQLRFN